MQGKLIVIEGTDGSGKATQSKLLCERLKKEGHAVEFLDFPQYGKPSAAMVELYLNGKFGTVDEVGPYAASILYAVDRFERRQDLLQWLNQGKIIICNRYVPSNQGHQAGKIHDAIQREKFLKWLDNLEYTIFGIPRPNRVIFLHMPCEIGQKLVDSKGARSYVKGKDIHEADLSHLKNAEKVYLEIAKRQDWYVIECSHAAAPLSIGAIHEMVYLAFKKA